MDKGFSAVLTIDLDDKLGGEAKQVNTYKTIIESFINIVNRFE